MKHLSPKNIKLFLIYRSLGLWNISMYEADKERTSQLSVKSQIVQMWTNFFDAFNKIGINLRKDGFVSEIIGMDKSAQYKGSNCIGTYKSTCDHRS